MENKINPEIQSDLITPSNPIKTERKTAKLQGFLISIPVFIVIAAGTVFTISANLKKVPVIPKPPVITPALTITPLQPASITVPADSQTGRKIYRSLSGNFEFQYPGDLSVSQTEQGGSIQTKNNNTIDFYFLEDESATIALYLTNADRISQTAYEGKPSMQVQSTKKSVINGLNYIQRREYLTAADLTQLNTYFKNGKILVSISLRSAPGNPPQDDATIYQQILGSFRFSDGISAGPEIITGNEISATTCSIDVTTNKRRFSLPTNWTETGPSSKCYQFVKNIRSASGKYLAFEDISGGVDSQVRIYSITQTDTRSHSLDVLGTSRIFDMIFLPDDRLAVLNGYAGEFSEFGLIIYDIPKLYASYPGNLNNTADMFNGPSGYKKIIGLPDIGKDYNSLNIANNLLKIYGTAGVGSKVLGQYKTGSL